MRNFRLPNDWIRVDQRRIDDADRTLYEFLGQDENSDLALATAARVGCLDVTGGGARYYRHNTDISYASSQRRYKLAASNHKLHYLAPSVTFWSDHFIEYASTHRPSSVHLYGYGIANLFLQNGLPSPTRTFTHRRLMRRICSDDLRKPRHAKALVGNDASLLLSSLRDDTLASLRDLAICTIGLTRGFRSASLAAILIEDISFEDRGVLIGLRNEKTSYGGETIFTGTPHSQAHKYCAPCCVQRLVLAMQAAGFHDGPLFRSIDRWGYIRSAALAPKAITGILRRALRDAGVADPDSYSSHSFRHGVVANAYQKGLPPEKIMLVTLHRSIRGLEPYLRSIDPWYRSPAEAEVATFAPALVHGQGWIHGPV